jgi:hypothetical protein
MSYRQQIEQFHALTTPVAFISLTPTSPHGVTALSWPGPLAGEVSRSQTRHTR